MCILRYDTLCPLVVVPLLLDMAHDSVVYSVAIPWVVLLSLQIQFYLQSFDSTFDVGGQFPEFIIVRW